jgi:hypothetical protein
MNTGDYCTVKGLDGPRKDECAVARNGVYKIVKSADVTPAQAPEEK